SRLFFSDDTATSQTYTLSLHDALPILARAPTPRPAVVETPGVARTLPPTPLARKLEAREFVVTVELDPPRGHTVDKLVQGAKLRSEEHTSELQSRSDLVCRLLLEKKKK